MTTEPWANAELSAELLSFCQRGESETVEFKRELPKQVRDLAKEIAAFSSTRGGRLLIGVADDGTIPGVSGAHEPAVRDELERRIIGVCQTIDPPVRPQIAWASADGVGVLIVTVEKGSEPLYYVDSKPYLRHGTVSRPATPAEVRAAASQASKETGEKASTHTELSELAVVLTKVLRWRDTDAEMRCLKPWVDEWEAEAESHAGTLREIASTGWAVTNRADERLLAMADKLDEVAHFQHRLGGGDSFDEVCRSVGSTAAELMRDLVDPVQVSEESQAEVLAVIAQHSRKLTQIWARADKNIFDGRVEQAQQETYAIGQQIADWTYYNLTRVPQTTLSDVRRIGLGLVQLAAMRVYMDGGVSLQRVVDAAQVLVNDLNSNVAGFPKLDG